MYAHKEAYTASYPGPESAHRTRSASSKVWEDRGEDVWDLVGEAGDVNVDVEGSSGSATPVA